MPRSWTSIEDFEDFLNAGGIVEADDDMPAEYRKAVFRFIELHANSELMGGLTERDWIPRTPGLRHKMAVLAKTQDEIGHAHLLYMVAADMKLKSRREMIEDLFAGKSRFHNVFHYKAKTWGDQVAIAFLVDAAALALSSSTSQTATRSTSSKPRSVPGCRCSSRARPGVARPGSSNTWHGGCRSRRPTHRSGSPRSPATKT